MAEDGAVKFLSQADFARRRDVSRKAVTSWKQKGLLVFSDAGLIDVEQTEWNLDQRPAVYRGGVTHRPVRKVTGNNEPKVTAPARPAAKKPEPAPIQHDDEPPDEGDEPAPDLDGNALSMADALKRKENYLGLLRKHEFEIAQGKWVLVEDVGRLVEREYEAVKERLLTVAGKIADSLVGKDRAQIETIVRAEITEALDELHDPTGIAGSLGAIGTPEQGAGSTEAAAAPKPDRMG